ncbi:DUF3784 domain-containing protein [Winogradskyella vincentii]|uniref:DUF3784 domain-containing protein n=1 Tax=Winogradskyella vincentii TaxID=2877122 RepID=A0ABS7Y2I7_9FLAO|nr:DUF3784 domain-containing protein [Winogradskyella vincentii]
MFIGQFILSTILIVCALLINRNPNLIAGYNSLSAEEKAKIDIKSLSKFLMTVLIVIGLTTLVLCIILANLDIKAHYIYLVNCTIIVLGVIIASIYANNSFKVK